MNSDDEVVAYYSNNPFNKFYKKLISGNIKNSYVKNPLSNSSAEKKCIEKEEKKEEEKKFEQKLKGDPGYNCNYCNGNNHLAKDFMIRKKEEKKEKVKDKAYYAIKLEEVHGKTNNLSLAAKDVGDDDGSYQI